MNWLIVIGKADALKWIVDHRRMAFRQRVKTEALRPGHRFVIYTSRGAYGNPTKDESQLAGLGTVTSAVAEGDVAIGTETFSKSCSIALELVAPLRAGIPFRPLIPHLDFVGRSERRWPSAVHRTLVPVEDNDFEVMRRALRSQCR